MLPHGAGIPGGTVPFRYGEAKGIFSFEKRMSPRPPKEKRGGISISPRTPLKRHKGAGCGPNTVMAIRFPALMGRQSCHFLESTSLYPPPAALWCFPLWKPFLGEGDRPRLWNPLLGMGSGSGKRSRWCPLCSQINAIPADAGDILRSFGDFRRSRQEISGFCQQCVPVSPSFWMS